MHISHVKFFFILEIIFIFLAFHYFRAFFSPYLLQHSNVKKISFFCCVFSKKRIK